MKVLLTLITLSLTLLNAHARSGCNRKMDKIISAMLNNNFAEAEKLSSKNGLKPNCVDDKKVPPLAYAVFFNQLKIASNFLKAGARADTIIRHLPQYPHRSEYTALHLAYDKPEMAKLLLDHGASVLMKDSKGRNAAHEAADVGGSPVVLELLINKSPNAIQEKDWNNCYPLHFAALSTHGLKVILSRLTSEQKENQFETRCLNTAQLDQFWEGALRFTPYQMAIQYKNKDAVRLFIAEGESKNDATSAAIHSFDKEFLKELIGIGAKVKSADLWALTTTYDLEFMKFAVENLADLNQDNLDKALHHLVKRTFKRFVITIPVAKLLIDLGADYRYSDESGVTTIEAGYKRCGPNSNPEQPCDLVKFTEGYSSVGSLFGKHNVSEALPSEDPPQ